MKGSFSFTAIIEKDPETGLFVGYIPELPGAHTQAETLDELNVSIRPSPYCSLSRLWLILPHEKKKIYRNRNAPGV
jgi:hypothetical protein